LFITSFYFLVSRKQVTNISPPPIGRPTPTLIPPTGTNQPKIIVDKENIQVKTVYEDGLLKYSGTVQLPTPCHQLKDETGVLQTYPEQVQIRLVVEAPVPDLVCTQVIVEKEFSGQVQVSSGATVSVFLDGTKIK